MENGVQRYDPSASRLMRLMDTRLPEIIREEVGNEQCVRLYGTGDYWSAFEHSAYLLCQLFPTIDVSIVTHPATPFPAVMVCISDEELRAYGREHIFCRDFPDYKEFLVTAIIPERYRIWRQKAIRKFRPPLAAVRKRA